VSPGAAVSWTGTITAGTVHGLAGFADGRAPVVPITDLPGNRGPESESKAPGAPRWKRWYTYAITGALVGLATLLVVNATVSQDDLTVHVHR
jgi:hypothetical protein